MGDLYYTFTHIRPFNKYAIRSKQCYLTNYLLYAFEYKLNKIPEWMLFKDWNKIELFDYTTDERTTQKIKTYSYAFDIYY